MLRFRRSALAVLVLITLWPTMVLGQTQRAGLVTLLEGTATVRRVAHPEPLPLKFKDDVFMHDRVETGEKSLVRLLLGGAALVTIRARTVATITETPGKSTIDLASGKIAVAVARDRLRPGDSIEIRTLNALAGIRGTVVVAEVSQATAQLGAAAAAAITTNFYVLHGMVNVQNFDPTTTAPLSQPQTIAAGQNFRATGSAPPIVAPNPPTNVVTSGLQPSAPQHTQAANQEQVTAQAVQSAAALVQTLLGPAPGDTATAQTADGTSAAAITLPSAAAFPNLASTLTSPNVLPPLLPGGTDSVFASAVEVTTPAPPLEPPQSEPPVVTPPTTETGTESTSQSPPPGPPPVIDPLAGLGLATAIQPFRKDDPDPVVVVSALGEALQIAGAAIQVASGSTVELARPLLRITERDVSADTLLSVEGSLVNTGTAPLIAIDPSTITMTGDLINIAGTLVLAGALLTSAGDTFQLGGNLLTVGGTLTSTTLAALVQLVGSTVVADHLIHVLGSATVAGPLLTVLLGSFLNVSGTLLTVSGTLTSTSPAALLLLSNSGANVLSGTVVAIAGGAIATAAALLRFENEFGGAGLVLVSISGGGSLTAGGPVVEMVNSGFGLTEPVVTLAGGSALQVTNGPVVSVNGVALLADALISADGTAGNTINVGELLRLSGGAVATLQELVSLGAPTPAALTIAPPPGSAVVVIEDGQLIVTGPAALTFGGSFARVRGTNTAAAPVLALMNTTLTGTTIDPAFVIDALGQVMTMAAPLLLATNTMVTTAGAAFVVQNGTLASTTTDPFLQFIGTAPGLSAVTAGQQFLALFSATPGAIAPVVELDGPLLSALRTVFTTGNPLANTFSLLFVGDGAMLTSTSEDALLSFDASTVNTSGSLVSLRRSPTAGTPSRMTLVGPLFSAVNGSTFDTSSLGSATGGACCPAFSVAQGAQLTSTTLAALIQLSNSTLRAGPDAQSGSSIFSVSDSAGLPGELVAPATVTLAGGLLDATGSTLSALFHLLNVTRSTLTSTSADPLIDLTLTTATLGGVDPITEANSTARVLNLAGSAATPAILTIAGSLLRAIDATIVTTSQAFGIFTGGVLTQHDTTDPLISLTRGSITSGTHLFEVSGFTAAGSVLARLFLSGPLLVETHTTLAPRGNLLRIAEGASVTSTTSDPMVTLNGGSFTGGPVGTVTGASLLRMFSRVGQAGTVLTLAGPYVVADGTTIVSGDSPVFNLADGATITSTSALPFASFTGGSVTSLESEFFFLGGGTSFTVPGQPTTVGSGVAPIMSLAGALVHFIDAQITVATDLIELLNGASLTSTSLAPLVSILRGAVDIATAATGTTGRILFMSGMGPLGSSSLTLAGPLLSAVDTEIHVGNPLANVSLTFLLRDGARLTSTTPLPLLSFTDTLLDTSGNFFDIRAGAAMTLAGALLVAVGGSFDTTTAAFTGLCCIGFRIGSGVVIHANDTVNPFIQLTNVVFNSGPDAHSGNHFILITDTGSTGDAPAPATVNLKAPLLRQTGGLITAAFNLVNVTRSSVTSTTLEALIDILGGDVRAGGFDTSAFASGVLQGSLFSVSAAAGNSNGPASVNLQGPLFHAMGATLTATGDAFGVFNGASLISAAASALIGVQGSLLVGGADAPPGVPLVRSLVSIGARGGPGGAVPASLTLTGAGGLLSAIDSALRASGHLINVFDGGMLSSATVDALATLVRTLIHARAFFQMSGVSVATVAGPVLRALDSTLILSEGLVAVPTNSTLITAPPGGAGAYPLVALDFSEAGHATLGSNAIFAQGVATDTFVDPDFGPIPNLGTDRPLRHQGGGAMLDVTAARNDLTPDAFDVEVTGNVVRVDTALVEATAPFIAMVRSAMKSSSDAVNIFQKARVEAGADVLRLDRSRLDVLNGNLVTVGGGSLLRANNLLSVAHGSRVNILNGTLLTLTGNSFANVAGCLVCFIGSNNVVSVTNGIASTGTLFGFPIAGTVQVGAGATQASVFPGVGANGNQLNVSAGGVLLNVTAGSTLKVQ